MSTPVSVNIKPNSESARWTNAELDVFLTLMIENVKKGNKTNSTFNKVGWHDIKTRLESRIGGTFTKDQLRNKLNKMRQDYSSFKKLLETSGCGWNPITKTACVDDESVWDRATQANPTWTKFKKNGLPYWPELQMIFGDSYARDDLASSQAMDSDEEDIPQPNIDVDDFIPNTPLQGGLDDIEDFNEDEELPSGNRRLDRTPTSLSKKKKKFGIADKAMEAIGALCKAKLDKCISASTTSNTPSPSSSLTVDCSSYACTKLLDSIPDVNDEMYRKAIKTIRNDPQWREIFMAAVPTRRIFILQDLLDDA